MTHKRFRGCVAWSMVVIAGVVIMIYDIQTAAIITMLALIVAAIAPLFAGY